jgi:hypothetical protein
MKAVLVVLASVILLGSLSQASAIVYLGDPIEGGSWRQRMQESGITFDCLRVDWVSGPQNFEVPFFQNLNQSGWTTAWSTPTSAAIQTATAISNMQFDFCFDGSSSQPIEFMYAAYHGADVQLAQHVWWNPGWVYPSVSDWDPGLECPNPDPPIPEPTSLALLGFGVAALGLWRKVRKS